MLLPDFEKETTMNQEAKIAESKKLHNPERRHDETQQQYHARLSASRVFGEHLTMTGAFKHGEKTTGREDARAVSKEAGTMKKKAGHYGRYLRDWITNAQWLALKAKNDTRMA